MQPAPKQKTGILDGIRNEHQIGVCTPGRQKRATHRANKASLIWRGDGPQGLQGIDKLHWGIGRGLHRVHGEMVATRGAGIGYSCGEVGKATRVCAMGVTQRRSAWLRIVCCRMTQARSQKKAASCVFGGF